MRRALLAVPLAFLCLFAAPAVAGTMPSFPTVAAAKAHCPNDTIVWVAHHSKVFHLSSSRYYGKTKRGAYACERDAIAAGKKQSKV